MMEDLMWILRDELLIACANRGYSPEYTIALLLRLERGSAEDVEELQRLGLLRRKENDP